MLKKIFSFFTFLFLISCQNFGQLSFLADLPKDLKEVSGNETIRNSNLIWMLNDGGNESKIYAVSEQGKIKREVYIKNKNHDWEDLTSDEKGNIYIGDFGNNLSKRKNLTILKIEEKYLKKKNTEAIRIEFTYENQHKFPPKKKGLYFDAEAFFYFKGYMYIFTKSRVHNKYGKTFLYKLPAKKGKHIAKLIGEFENCNDLECWITSADISADGKKVALLSQKNILIFSDYKEDNFLSGNVKKIELEHRTQKEGLCFKDNYTLLITDEKAHGVGGNLYELKVN
ncbi:MULTISPECIES: hypothetical protein [unclassified Polaribacter]|jgi:hypothetical protein|uniref:hypothetical protein n=1 Tax=unclassified Polaribacter TaxID=196858 RepID=UPI00052B6106|nr:MULTISPECIES: hypothetical protein [unclassified Polaribacter]KGL58490.1 hypothetical protein PHEL49_2644 [Polaribacter sp. Hel1_33_49]PKV65850.1 hypothetical protein ATE90_2302 [Polaribacter sp. Hel1_33_96]